MAGATGAALRDRLAVRAAPRLCQPTWRRAARRVLPTLPTAASQPAPVLFRRPPWRQETFLPRPAIFGRRRRVAAFGIAGPIDWLVIGDAGLYPALAGAPSLVAAIEASGFGLYPALAGAVRLRQEGSE